jgi:hypothetical protein
LFAKHAYGLIHVSDRIRTCYISAPAGSNLDVLRDELAAKGIRVVVPSDLPIGRVSPSEIGSILGRVDLVIGVLTQQRRSEWVLFELGQAFAQNRRILLLAPPKSILLPTIFQRFPVVRASLKNREAIRFALDQMLAAPGVPATTTTTKPIEGSGIGTRADVLLGSVKTAIESGDERALEQIAALALRNSGVEVIAEQAMKGRHVDLAIWSDALQPFVGNPLLVEIRTRLRSQKEAQAAFKTLALAIAASGTTWGLMLYGESSVSEQRLRTSAPPTVLVLSFTSLLEGMREHPFNEVVRDLRNRRVHGGSA